MSYSLRSPAICGALAILAAACSGAQPISVEPAATVFVDEPGVEATPTSAERPAETVPAEPTVGAVPAPASLHIEGHRGARGLKPENTLPGFETALDIGVTTLELDLHLSADDEVIVWHDDALTAEKCRLIDGADPTLGSLDADGGVPIRSLTAEQLSGYMCDVNPDTNRFPDQENGPTLLAGANYRPVLLADVFAFVAEYSGSSDKTDEQRAQASTVEFNIETKRDPADPSGIGDGFDGTNPGPFELEVLAAVEAAGLSERVVIQSFDHRSLWAIRSVNPDIRLAALTIVAPDLPEYAARGAAIWSPNFNTLTDELVQEAHALGLLVIPWTVNQAEDMRRLFELGVDGLITDRPDIAATLR